VIGRSAARARSSTSGQCFAGMPRSRQWQACPGGKPIAFAKATCPPKASITSVWLSMLMRQETNDL
jgi:hypothetical protein